MSPSSKRPALLLGLAVLVAIVGMLPGFGGEYRRSWLGHNGARYTQIARNHLRLGWVEGGAPLLVTAGEEPGAQSRYLHHPPGVGWTLAAVFAVTGVDEDVARGVSALATLASLLLLARLVSSVSCRQTGALAALIAACLPMTWIFGTHVEVQGPAVLAASFAALLAGRSAVRGGPLWPALLWTLVAGWLDWYGLYAPVLAGLLTPTEHPGGRRRGWFLAAWAGFVFAGLIVWLGTRPGAPGPALLLEAASERAPEGLAIGRSSFLGRWFTQVQALMPGWPLMLAAVLFWCVRSPKGERQLLAGQLLLPPILHGAVFPAGMLEHGYWLFGLAPALGAGVALLLGGRLLIGLGLAAGLAVAGILLREDALEIEDPGPALAGSMIAAHVPDGEWVLTNYDTNVLIPDAEGDRFVMMRPAVTFYADRPVRGGIDSTERLEDALRRLPHARWFLVSPFPAPVDAALAARLEQLSTGESIVLSEEPLAMLVPLKD